MKKIQKHLREAFFCTDRKTVLLFALSAVLAGVLFAFGGINRYVLGHLLLPRGTLPPFFAVLLWGAMLTVFGASVGLAVTSRACDRHVTKNTLMLLFGITLILCCVWIPLVYKAAALFLALLVALMLSFCVLLLLSAVWHLQKGAMFGVAVFALFVLYILYYTFALFLLN